MIKDHGIFSMMIILLILITLSLDSVWILLGENCCWSLLGLKGAIESVGINVLSILSRLNFFAQKSKLSALSRV